MIYQYIVQYPNGTTTCPDGTIKDNLDMAADIIHALRAGQDVVFPDVFKLTVLKVENGTWIGKTNATQQ